MTAGEAVQRRAILHAAVHAGQNKAVQLEVTRERGEEQLHFPPASSLLHSLSPPPQCSHLLLVSLVLAKMEPPQLLTPFVSNTTVAVEVST